MPHKSCAISALISVFIEHFKWSPSKTFILSDNSSWSRCACSKTAELCCQFTPAWSSRWFTKMFSGSTFPCTKDYLARYDTLCMSWVPLWQVSVWSLGQNVGTQQHANCTSFSRQALRSGPVLGCSLTSWYCTSPAKFLDSRPRYLHQDGCISISTALGHQNARF